MTDVKLKKLEHRVTVILARALMVQEIEASRQSKLASMQRFITKKNAYLREHPKARVGASLKEINSKLKKLRINTWTSTFARPTERECMYSLSCWPTCWLMNYVDCGKT